MKWRNWSQRPEPSPEPEPPITAPSSKLTDRPMRKRKSGANKKSAKKRAIVSKSGKKGVKSTKRKKS